MEPPNKGHIGDNINSAVLSFVPILNVLKLRVGLTAVTSFVERSSLILNVLKLRVGPKAVLSFVERSSSILNVLNYG